MKKHILEKEKYYEWNSFKCTSNNTFCSDCINEIKLSLKFHLTHLITVQENCKHYRNKLAFFIIWLRNRLFLFNYIKTSVKQVFVSNYTLI